MEPQCRDTNSWPGQIKVYRGSRLYFDFSDDENFDAKIQRLMSLLLATAGRNAPLASVIIKLSSSSV